MGIKKQQDIPSPIADERRKSSRRKVQHAGILVYEDGAIRVDCLIQDLSKSGALVEVSKDTVISKECWLIHLREDVAYKVETIRRNPGSFGLRIVERIDLPHNASLAAAVSLFRSRSQFEESSASKCNGQDVDVGLKEYAMRYRAFADDFLKRSQTLHSAQARALHTNLATAWKLLSVEAERLDLLERTINTRSVTDHEN